MVPRIGIIGAGIVGLTTALELQTHFYGSELTILADKFYQETTSDGAAGIFRPGSGFSGPNDQITREWIQNSFHYYNDLLSVNCGISEISGYIFSNSSPAVVRNNLLEGLVPVYRAASEDELSLCPGEWKYGSFFQTLLIECRTFLPWAVKRFKAEGGTVVRTFVNSLSELEGKFDVVVNCSGLGAKFLCEDKNLIPIRGQVMKVEAPWLNHFYYGDFDTYIIPMSNGTATLGGSRHFDSWRTKACLHDGAAILERCIRMVPRLSQSTVLWNWVGLRPYRHQVRVESQIVSKLKVVHNYGHGGYGITSAPGTAKCTVNLVKHLLCSRSKL